MDDEYRVISSEEFDDASADLTCNGTVFRYCDFTGLMHEGGAIDATFIGGSFKECDFYWTLFNICLFVDMHFERCIFRGVSFPGCRFLNCRFIDCSFVADSFGGLCSFDETGWYDTEFLGCTGAHV